MAGIRMVGVLLIPWEFGKWYLKVGASLTLNVGLKFKYRAEHSQPVLLPKQ